MARLSSQLKTWLRRNGFRGEGKPGNRVPLRECNGYVERGGYKFRFMDAEGWVDISCPIHDFDRWANSTDDTVPIDFLQRIMK